MKQKRKKIRVGIVGCGAIGSGIAKSVKTDLKATCQLAGLYDIDLERSRALAKQLRCPVTAKKTLTELIRSCDLMVEAVSAQSTHAIIKQALTAKKHILSMCVGKVLGAHDLFKLANKVNRNLMLPSGAIAGVDAIKAASLVNIKRITLTTRKPPVGLGENKYIEDRGINLAKIKDETLIFEGNVDTAVKLFPKNINVAATLAFASNVKDKIKVRIFSSPKFKNNSHEIEVIGDFGRIHSKTENAVCPDNPKTSYLAVLSGIQTIKQFCQGLKIGT